MGGGIAHLLDRPLHRLRPEIPCRRSFLNLSYSRKKIMNIMLSDPQPQLWISALCPWNPTNDPNRPLGYVWRNCGGGLHCRMESTKGRYFNLSFPVLKMLSHENAIFHARSRRSPKNNSRGPLWYRMRAASSSYNHSENFTNAHGKHQSGAEDIPVVPELLRE